MVTYLFGQTEGSTRNLTGFRLVPFLSILCESLLMTLVLF